MIPQSYTVTFIAQTERLICFLVIAFIQFIRPPLPAATREAESLRIPGLDWECLLLVPMVEESHLVHLD